MTGNVSSQLGRVESFPSPIQSTAVSDELGRIRDLLQREFSEARQVSFSFDGRLQVHIDVRKVEDIAVVEAKLPSLAGGLFSNVRHGSTPGHAFLHRVSAVVAR